METYDLVMLAVLGGTTFFGFLKGFAWQVASVASLTLSYFCAYHFADRVAPLLNADPRWSKYLAMLLIYCGTGFVVWMGFRLVSGAIDQIRLRDFDRQVGGLVGAGKGILLCTVITFFAVSLSEQSRAAVLRSRSGVYISKLIHKASPIVPPEWTTLTKGIEKLGQGLNPNEKVEHPSAASLPANMQAYGNQVIGNVLSGQPNQPTAPQSATQPFAQPYGQYQYGAPSYSPQSIYNNVPGYGQQPNFNPQPYAPPPYYGPTQPTRPSNPYSSGS
jgi:membrane protein required for colicin V production